MRLGRSWRPGRCSRWTTATASTTPGRACRRSTPTSRAATAPPAAPPSGGRPRSYPHESCGKCTPCREGTWWMPKLLRRIEHGHGRMDDMPLMQNVGDNILFKAFCALADGAISPIHSSLKFFMDEYEEHVRLGRC